MKKLLMVLFVTLPSYLFSQSIFENCDKVFTKTQQMPSLKISGEAYADSISLALKAKNISIKEKEITFKFVLTDEGNINVLKSIYGAVENEIALKETILKFENLWKPAIQNGRLVCSIVLLKLEFLGNKIKVDISQE